MLKKINFSSKQKRLTVYIFLTFVTLAVFRQTILFDFIFFDDAVYVTHNTYIKSGLTMEGIRWAFSTTYAQFWHPLTWLSFLFDYQLHGLNPGGYHMTNILLHMLSTLLLFWFFNQLTGEIWKSAFVAAFFAIHPLRLESVASIAQRKDVLSVFFWMLTLCLYVYYTEKPAIKRYLLVLCGFVLALMSKPMVVTLPIIMILLDYWPLSRFRIGIESQKENFVLWQLREKIPLFVLSALFSIIAVYAHKDPAATYSSAGESLIKAPIHYLIYLGKIVWPRDLTLYPFYEQLSLLQISCSVLLTLLITVALILNIKRWPGLFTGWLWYIITLLPVLGIIQGGGIHSMADHYTYLPSIGIAVMLAWGVPILFPRESTRKTILFPASTFLLALLALLTWQLCSYAKNNASISSVYLQMTQDDYLKYDSFYFGFPAEKKIKKAIDHYNEVIRLHPDDAYAYNNRGTFYNRLGHYQRAINDYNQAIRLKPDYSLAYSNSGVAYLIQGFKHQFCSDVEKACSLGNCKMLTFAKCHRICVNPVNARAFNDRGIDFSKKGQYQTAIEDFNQALRLQPDFPDAYNNRGLTYSKNKQYRSAIDDFNNAIILKPDFAEAYINRGITYLMVGDKELGCIDARLACKLGNCKFLEMAKGKNYCP